MSLMEGQGRLQSAQEAQRGTLKKKGILQMTHKYDYTESAGCSVL